MILALEVSWVVDGDEVERAIREAAILRKRGLPAIPAVGGAEILAMAEEKARSEGVLVVTNGVVQTHRLLE